MNGSKTPLTTAVDIFALGLIFHQYLTGKLPVFSPAYHYAFEALLNGDALTVASEIPKPLQNLICTMLQRDPELPP